MSCNIGASLQFKDNETKIEKSKEPEDEDSKILTFRDFSGLSYLTAGNKNKTVMKSNNNSC